MAGSIYDWSTTAGNNGSADGDINWAEGQAPSTVNNSARQMMGRLAEFIGDEGGSLSAGGTPNGITVTANSSFTSYADGRIIAFKAASDNTGSTTLNVNGIGAKAVRKITTSGDVALEGGEIQEGGIFVLRYNSSLNSSAGGWQILNPAVAFGTMADQDADSVNITGGTATLSTVTAEAAGGEYFVAKTTGDGTRRFVDFQDSGDNRIGSILISNTNGSGAGTMDFEDADSYSFDADVSTTGALTLGTDLAISEGGTGASSASSARSNLGLGSIATQDADSVDINGGAIDGVNIGTSVPVGDLVVDIIARDNNIMFFRPGGPDTTSGQMQLATDGDLTISGDLLTGNGGVEAFEFAREGNTMFFRPNGLGNNTNAMTLETNGDLTVSGDITANSDERLKTDWSPLDSGFLGRLAAAKAGTYTRTDTGRRQVGVEAQSFESVIPEAVHENDEGYLSLAYGQAALAATVELAREVVRLKKQVGLG